MGSEFITYRDRWVGDGFPPTVSTTSYGQLYSTMILSPPSSSAAVRNLFTLGSPIHSLITSLPKDDEKEKEKEELSHSTSFDNW